MTPPFAVPDGEWLNGKPNTEGKIIVAYLWHPAEKELVTDLMLKMEDLHKQQGRDIAVMGFMIPTPRTAGARVTAGPDRGQVP